MGFPVVLPDGLDDAELDPVGAIDTDLGGREGPGDIGEEFAQFLSGFGEDLQQTDGGIDGVVKAEIAVGEEDVTAHLSGQERLFLLHLSLDQRVPCLPHDRPSAVPGDVVVEFLRTFDLADDGGAGILLQDEAGEEQQKLIAPEDISAVGDHADPVGVSVIGDTGVGLLFQDEADQFPEIIRDGGIGKVVGEAAVRIAVDVGNLAAVALQQGEGEKTAHAVAAVENDPVGPA